MYKLILGPLLFLLYGFSVGAQKLPNLQQSSMRAPANIKIDGKPIEWGQYQAYNRATEIFTQ